MYLGKLGNPDVLSKLIPMLHNSDKSVRIWTTNELGNLGGRAAVPELLKILGDPDFIVRRVVAKALGKIGDPVAVPELLNTLHDSDESSIRQEAAEALGKIGDPVAVPELLKALHDLDYDVRGKAAEALAQINDLRAVPGLLKMLRSQNRRTRFFAAEVLGKIGDPVAVSELRIALHDFDDSVRQAVVNALAKLGDPSAIPELLKVLKEERSTYTQAIDAIKGIQGTEGLLNALRDPESKAHWELAKQLARIPREDIPLLLEALNDQDYRVRAFVAYALGERGKDARKEFALVTVNLTIEECLIRLLKGRPISQTSPFVASPPRPIHPLVLCLAAEALGKLKSTAAIPSIANCLENKMKVFSNSNERVCDAAIKALKSIGTSEALGAIELAQIDSEVHTGPNFLDAFGFRPRISRSVYDEAMLFPQTHLRLHKPELQYGEVERIALQTATGSISHPWSIEGSSAFVYKFRTQSGKIRALRCFKNPTSPDLPFRYKWMGKYFNQYVPSITVNFMCHEAAFMMKNNEGKPMGQPYPIVEMEWVEGVTLLEKVHEFCKARNQVALQHLSEQWITVFRTMRQAGFAHGDLSGTDVMVKTDGSLVLIDYDGVYIPDFEGMLPIAKGKVDYQHPQMALRKFNERMDDFPALVIYTALLALAAQPDLWHASHSGKPFGTLLFTGLDFFAPQKSHHFYELEQMEDQKIKNVVNALKQACLQPIDEVEFPFHLVAH